MGRNNIIIRKDFAMKQMIQLRDDIMLGRTGAVKATLRRALSLALMIMLFINSVPFTHLTSAEETAVDLVEAAPVEIYDQRVRAGAAGGFHMLPLQGHETERG